MVEKWKFAFISKENEAIISTLSVKHKLKPFFGKFSGTKTSLEIIMKQSSRNSFKNKIEYTLQVSKIDRLNKVKLIKLTFSIHGKV